MSSLPKKVSRFKSDRAKRDDIQNASTPLSPAPQILGSIIEIKDTKQTPLGEIACTTPSGFPSCVRLTNVSFAAKPSSNISKRPMSGNAQPGSVVDYVSSDDFASINMKRVANMTEADVHSALQEISSSISTDNLEFLRRRGEKDLQHAAAILEHSDDVAIQTNVSFRKDQQSASLNKVDSSECNSKFKSKMSLSDINKQESMPSKINSLTSSSSSGGGGGNGISMPTKNSPSGQLHDGTTTTVRFDLSGRRIIDSKNTKANSSNIIATSDDENNSFVQWKDILSQSFLQYELSTEDLHDIALYCMRTLATSEFTLSLPAHDESDSDVAAGEAEGAGGGEQQQQQHEHGLEAGGAVGYSLSDACRFMCSEVKSQRLVGLRILNGAMSRRDVASSSEAYRMTVPAAGASTTPITGRGGDVVEHHASQRQNKRSKIPFHRSYAELFGYIVRKLSSGGSTGNYSGGEGVGGEGDVSPLQLDNISRVLTFAILKTSCAADFPPEVAYIIQWNLSELAPYASSIYQVQSLKSAFHFMFAGFECSAGDAALWTGVWGLYSSPFSFMTPLARRPEGSYASHAEACLRKHRAARADNDNNQSYRMQQQLPHTGSSSDGSPPPQLSGIAKRPYEEFAMLCRWNRIDVMLLQKTEEEGDGGGGDDVASALHRIMEDGLNRIISVCQQYSELQTSFFDNIQRADEDVLMVADVLVWCSRLISNCIRSGDISTVETLQRAVIATNWPKLSSLFSFCVSNGLLFPSSAHFESKALGMKLKCVCVYMWKIAAELARRSIKYAEMICTHSSEVLNVIITLTSMCDVQAKARGVDYINSHNNWTLHTDGETSTTAGDQSVLLWALRFWRCCVSYRISMGATLNLLLQLYSEGARFSAHYSKEAHVEILEFLEETAVACSAYFVGRTAAAAAAFGALSINDLMYIDISRVVFQITAVLVVEKGKQPSDVGGAMMTTSVASSFHNLVATVIGVDESGAALASSAASAPLSVMLASHIRGPGLCASILQFSNHTTNATGETYIEESDNTAPKEVDKEQLQSSLASIITTVTQLKNLFLELIDTRYVPVDPSSSLFGSIYTLDSSLGDKDGGGGVGTMSDVCLAFERILSYHRLALCFFSLVIQTDEDGRHMGALCSLVVRGEAWIRENYKYNEDSITAGLYSVKVCQTFRLIIVAHVQLFSLALSHTHTLPTPISKHPPLALGVDSSSSPSSSEAAAVRHVQARGLQHILSFLPALCRIAPFTACRCLHAVLTVVISAALASASPSSPPAALSSCNDAGHLVDTIMKATYGIKKRDQSLNAAAGSGTGEEDETEDEQTSNMNSILRNLSALSDGTREGTAGAGADSGFLYCDNNIQMASFSACSFLVNEHIEDHILFSSLSMLCRIDQHWMFSSLAGLKGVDLFMWLRVLHHMLPHQTHPLLVAPPTSAPAASATATATASVTAFPSSERQLIASYEKSEELAQQLYWLARLPASNISTFFNHHRPGTGQGAGGGGRQQQQQQQEEEDEGVAADPLSPVAQQYQQLLQRTYSLLFAEKLLSSQTQGKGAGEFDTYMEFGECLEVIASTQNRSLFISNKLLAASESKQSAPTEAGGGIDAVSMTRQHIQNKMRNRLKNRAGGKNNTQQQQAAAAAAKKSSSSSKCTGVEDLCERLVDSLANQHYDSCVHAASVSFILIPGVISWPLREKLWRTLGEMQLLHLLESVLLGGALAMFLDVDVLLQNYCLRRQQQKEEQEKQKEKEKQKVKMKSSPVAVVVAMADALLGLRSYSEERDLAITQIALFSIAYFIFHNLPAGGAGDSGDGGGIGPVLSGMKESLLMKLVNDHAQQERKPDDDGAGAGGSEGSCCVLVDVLRFASVLMVTEAAIARVFLEEKEEEKEENEEENEEEEEEEGQQPGEEAASALKSSSAAVLTLWAEALHDREEQVHDREGQQQQEEEEEEDRTSLPAWTRFRGELLPCLGRQVAGRTRQRREEAAGGAGAGRAVLVLDVLKDLCPDLLKDS